MEIDELLILNVNSAGTVNVGLGGDILLDVDGDSFRQHMAKEAAATEKSMQLENRSIKYVNGRPQLWTTIMIRADRDVEYERVQAMMKVCQEYGYYRFALRASPEPKSM
jgi:biopolymer transport protein ExbD